MKNNNIRVMYSNVKDYNREGVVNRFIETIRCRINKYLTAYNTNKYIDVLPKRGGSAVVVPAWDARKKRLKLI